MNPTQEAVKAWWFDRMSDLVAQNMALAAELAAMREHPAFAQHVPPEPRAGNGMAGSSRQEATHG